MSKCPFLYRVCKFVLYLVFIRVMVVRGWVRVQVVKVEKVVIINIRGDVGVID